MVRVRKIEFGNGMEVRKGRGLALELELELERRKRGEMRGENETQKVIQIGMAQRKMRMARSVGMWMKMRTVSDMGPLRLTGMRFLLLENWVMIWK